MCLPHKDMTQQYLFVRLKNNFLAMKTCGIFFITSNNARASSEIYLMIYNNLTRDEKYM